MFVAVPAVRALMFGFFFYMLSDMHVAITSFDISSITELRKESVKEYSILSCLDSSTSSLLFLFWEMSSRTMEDDYYKMQVLQIL